jgi:Domain of unknown function (DUF4395)
MTTPSWLPGFPSPVNEKAARVVAGGVALLAVAILLTGWHWLIAVMALGFLARVLSGPRLSVLGQIATRLIAPRLGPPTWVPGPPKRFAQAIGLVFTSMAALLSLAFNADILAAVLITTVLAFALMESVIGFCAACWLFGELMRAGLVPQRTCEACNSVRARYGGEPAEVGPLRREIPPSSVQESR